jgi:copper chaperone CopZ
MTAPAIARPMRLVSLEVTGMTSDPSARCLQSVLEELIGVQWVGVLPRQGLAFVRYDACHLGAETLHDAVRVAGYDVRALPSIPGPKRGV